MDDERYLECLAADYERLREVAAAADAGSAVPSCPGWTVHDLVQHVGAVYLNKVSCMREGKEPEPWPPAGLEDEDPIALLDRGYADLRAEFATRERGQAAGGWYAPDRTVGFWIRRMAQETIIHRIDAELAAGLPVADIPDDLAVDGIDELLHLFLAYSVAEWPEAFAESLDGSRPWTVAVRTQGAAWRIRTAPGALTVETGKTADASTGDDPSTGDPSPDASADAGIAGPPAALLRNLWNRETPASAALVTATGPAEAHTLLRACLTTATQ